MRIAIIRHGPTEWNEAGRIQGSIDTPLSAAGRAKMAALRPPEGFARARAFVSPLVRARETATLLGLKNPIVDARLAEHHWGKWEGLTREEILARDGADAFERAGLGLEFRPPGGESAQELRTRVNAFLGDVASGEGDAIAVAHRGIMRTAYAIATGWDMRTAMPEALDLTGALVLHLSRETTPTLLALNVPLSAARTVSNAESGPSA